MTTAINKANNIFNTINDNFNYLNNKVEDLSYSSNCPAITVSNGVATWSVTHNLNSQNVAVSLYNSSGQEQIKNVSIVSVNSLTVEFKASSNITAGGYKIVVKG